MKKENSAKIISLIFLSVFIFGCGNQNPCSGFPPRDPEKCFNSKEAQKRTQENKEKISVCPTTIEIICKDGSLAKYKENSCDLVCPEDEIKNNQQTNCAMEGENFSEVYKDNYKEKCCNGLTEWQSGFDTRISVADKCYETGLMKGSPVGTCINCGDGVCSKNESVCNCPKDCGAENSEFKTIKDFCFNEFELKKVCKYVPNMSAEKRKLCDTCCSSFGMCLN